MSTLYYIRIAGCDDSTRFTMMLNDSEVALLKRIAAHTEKHGGGCEPTLELSESPEDLSDYYTAKDYTPEETP